MPKILVVDDSAVDRRLVAGLLRKGDDYALEFADDGFDALARLEESPPDLILTDMIMPRLNGLELVGRVRATRRRIPVILMTSQGNEELAASALSQGAASYVPKRGLASELLPTVQRILALKEQWSQHERLMQHMVRSECEFLLRNDTSLIPSLVGYLQSSLTMTNLVDDADRMRIGVALEEALINAIHHGNLEVSSDLRQVSLESYHDLVRLRSQQSPYRDRQVHVFARFSRDEAEFRIRDEGPGFDPQSLPAPDDPANLDRPSGRGLVLMRFVMDEVLFNEQGNEVVLRKRCLPHTEEVEFELSV